MGAISTPNEHYDSEVPTSLWDTLTPREKEVALLLGRGDTSREIAALLDISTKTVDTHRLHVMKKLDCRNNVRLALYLVRERRMTP